MTTLPLAGPVAPYDALAPVYPLLCDDAAHRTWLAQIEELAIGHGLRGRRVLDVGCGAGDSFLAFLERGYAVTGCDQSAAMLEVAGERSGGEAQLLQADMRRLGAIGSFDLVTCLDDALNHLLDEGDLLAALRGIGANLAPGALVVFDLNTLATLRSAFSASWTRAGDEGEVRWEGLRQRGAGPRRDHERAHRDRGRRRGGVRGRAHHGAPPPARGHPGDPAGLRPADARHPRPAPRRPPELRPAEETDHKAIVVASRDTKPNAWALAHGHERRIW